MPTEQYQTVKEVADRLKVAEATVRHWIKLGELRAIDIGKGWRIADPDLERFLELHQTAPRSSAPSGLSSTGQSSPSQSSSAQSVTTPRKDH